MQQNVGVIMLIYASKHARLLIYGGKNATYDNIESKELPATFFFLRVEPCAAVRQSDKSASTGVTFRVIWITMQTLQIRKFGQYVGNQLP